MEQENYEGKTPEELVELLSKKDEALQQAEQDKTATVGELKDLRAKKQELEQKIELTQPKTEEQPDGAQSTEAQFEAFIQKKQKEESQKNREKAIEDFRASHHEFSESADPGGIKFSAFEREMSKFNLDNLSSVDDFNSRLTEVYDFMNRGKGGDEDGSNYHRGTNRTPSAPSQPDNDAIDTAEKKLIDNMGWTPERYLKLKEKMPDYIEQQLSYLR